MQDSITLQGEIELTKDGYIHLDNDTFANLYPESKEFVTKYNGNAKCGIPMKESEVPSVMSDNHGVMAKHTTINHWDQGN